LQKLYPGTENGVDYMTAHELVDGSQTGHAKLWWWKLSAPQPSQVDLEMLWAQYGPQILQDRIVYYTREERNKRLAEADTLVEKAIDKNDEAAEKAARDYRQALRDVPSQPGFPDNFTWPELPA
jgi:hypothetical protein